MRLFTESFLLRILRKFIKRLVTQFRKGFLEGGLGCLLWSEFEGGVGKVLRLFLGLGVEVWGGLKGGEEAFGDGGAGEEEETTTHNSS